jgi:hypothetical protein
MSPPAPPAPPDSRPAAPDLRHYRPGQSLMAQARALAQAHGLSGVFETARMYAGPRPACSLETVFGVTTFELG